jgi:methionine synthase II (cobalamin-independent)
MRTSRDRIPTTHTGSLPQPVELAELMVRREHGDLTDADAARLPDLIPEAIGGVVACQLDIGIEVVSDGETGKIGYSTYVKERMTGFDGGAGALALADLQDYPEVTERALAGLVTTTPACTGPVTYTGTAELVAERIARFAGVVGRERAVAGTDCGFSTFASFLPVHPAIGWAKLGSLVEGARLVSSRLFTAGAASEPVLA